MDRARAVFVVMLMLLPGVVRASEYIGFVDLFSGKQAVGGYVDVNHASRQPTTIGIQRDMRIVAGTTLLSPPMMWVEMGRVSLDAQDIVWMNSQLVGGTTGTIRWDGENASDALAPAGLGGLDLTNGGTTDRFRVYVVAYRPTPRTYPEMKLTVYTSATAISYVRPWFSGEGIVEIPFSSFQSTGGTGGADFTKVGAIVLELQGDMAIDSILVTSSLPTVQFEDFWLGPFTSPAVWEDGSLHLEVTRRGGDLSGTATVQYSTVNDTAVAGADYVETRGTVTFGPGEQRKTIQIPILADDVHEGIERFTLILSHPSGVTLGGPWTLSPEIHEERPELSLGDVAKAEGNGGTTHYEFTAKLSEMTLVPVVVEYTTSAGTGTPAADYTSASEQHVTIPAGTDRVTFTVDVAGDDAVEDDETFFVSARTISEAGPGAIATAVATILDDDGVANLSLTKTASDPAPLAGDDATYTLTVSNAGPLPATNVVVSDPPPPGTSFKSVTASAGTCTPAVTCTIPRLAVGATETITVVVKVVGSGPITNTASVSAARRDTTLANNEAAVTIVAEAVDPIPVNAPWILASLIAALGMAAIRLLR